MVMNEKLVMALRNAVYWGNPVGLTPKAASELLDSIDCANQILRDILADIENGKDGGIWRVRVKRMIANYLSGGEEE